MNYKYSVLTVLFLFALINGQGSSSSGTTNPTVKGFTMTSINLSKTTLNASNPLSESTTFTVDLQYTGDMATLYKGFFSTNIDNGWYIYLTTNNFFNVTANSATIQFCVPMNAIQNCDIRHEQSIQCEYVIGFRTVGQSTYTIFQSPIISEAFPNSVLTIVQNLMQPALNSFNINTHQVGSLVTFEFDISIFASGLNKLELDVYNSTGEYVTLTADKPTTSNGLYYLEYLVSAEGTGTEYYVDNLLIRDNEGNALELSTGQLQQKYNSSIFKIAKSSTPALSQLYTYVFNNPPANNSVSGTQISTFTFNISLADFQTAILNPTSQLSLCSTYYLNSTFVTLYCDIPPNQDDRTYEFKWTSANPYIYQETTIEYKYLNDNQELPVISQVQYSVETIDQLQPFYIETNITFETYSAYLRYISFTRVNGPYNIGLPDVQYGGSIFSGVASASWLLDSYTNNLTEYTILISDSKYYADDFKLKGPVTTPRYYSEDIQLTVEFGSLVFDFTNSSMAKIPFTITTSTKYNDILTEFMILYDYSHEMDIGKVDYNDVFGGIMTSNLTHTTFTSWITLKPNDLLEHDFIGGDFTITFDYEGYQNSLHYFTTKCLTLIPPPAQPTIVTNLQLSPSGPVIDSTQNDFLTLQFQTKGANVNYASVVFYQTEILHPLHDQPVFPCEIEVPYSYDTLEVEYKCNIPIGYLLTQTVFYYLKLGINNVETPIYNSILQSSGLPSFFEIQGPVDNGLVPTIQQFETSFSGNLLNITYAIDNPTTLPLNLIKFYIFNRNVPYYGDYYEKLSVTSAERTLLNGTFEINVCDLEGFTFDFIGNFGVYISIPSPLPGVNYEFPYDILVNMDSNKQQFPNTIQCDYSGPRVVEFGIEDIKPYYDSSSSSQNITVSFTITDDLTGFSLLQGTIRSNTSSTFYFVDFYVFDSDLVSGNLNNGIYQVNITIPQFSNGTYIISVISVLDQNFNKRFYTTQNAAFLSKAYVFEAYTSLDNPSIPSIQSITNTIVSGENNIVVTLDTTSEISSILMGLSTNSDTPYIGLTPMGSNSYHFNAFDNLDLSTGTYYINLCIEYSLTLKCYSSLDLEQLGFTNNIYYYNPYIQ
ncbi:EGF-like domain-containing protein [Tieghemostelium lacteum]|uniref:EGF-like domain-containing protein n=1 Tax=Tieghemostelium lacteum TaxID=361077 RepID=A0A152A7L5_TIELA|nr:EGF-like domain-containing protein [Tieghemostelium lacteum]|eukprot:KYR02121.1 EGF-like domain-containing protein [Tieghemostelium lacteum]